MFGESGKKCVSLKQDRESSAAHFAGKLPPTEAAPTEAAPLRATEEDEERLQQLEETRVSRSRQFIHRFLLRMAEIAKLKQFQFHVNEAVPFVVNRKCVSVF